MMEIVLVRHAQPHWEPDGKADDNPGLTELGFQQAQRLPRALVHEPFDAFYVSPLRRCLQTAAPLAGALGMEAQVLPWLEEVRMPSMGGQPAEVVHRFIADFRAQDLERWWDGPPGGETFRHFHERLVSGVEPLLTRDHRMELHRGGAWRLWQVPPEPQRLLVVCHAGVSAVLMSHLLGIEPVPWEWERFHLGWAGIARLVTNRVAGGAVWQLRSYNERMHLAGLPDPPG